MDDIKAFFVTATIILIIGAGTYITLPYYSDTVLELSYKQFRIEETPPTAYSPGEFFIIEGIVINQSTRKITLYDSSGVLEVLTDEGYNCQDVNMIGKKVRALTYYTFYRDGYLTLKPPIYHIIRRIIGGCDASTE